jgi:hypothetical protein
MVDNRIILNFEIEKGELIAGQSHFSARIKLTNKSQNLLREKLGSTIQFDNLGDYLNLNSENFYIYYNKYSGYDGRSELYIKSNDGRYLTSNLPLNHYGFSIELSSGGVSITDYGFYPLYAIYNPNHYNKAQEKVFDDYGELLPITSNVLDNFLSNTNGLTTQEIFLQLQNEITEKEAKLTREKRQAEEELDQKNEELKEFIEKGEITLFKVAKDNDVGNGRSAVVLQFTEESKEYITLDSQKFYIAEYGDNEYLHCVSSGYDMLLDYENLFFVLNRSSYSDLDSGFYPMFDFDSYASNLSTKNQYFSDDQLSEKLGSSLEESDSRMDSEVTIDGGQTDEEVVGESEIKSRKKRVVGEYNTENAVQEEEFNYIDQMQSSSSSYVEDQPASQSNRDDYADMEKALQEELHRDEMHKQHNEKAEKDIEAKKVTVETDSSSHKTEKQTKPIEDEQETVMASVMENMDDNSDSEAEASNSVANSQHPLKIKTGEPLEVGKYKVELQVTYDDVKNFYDTVRNKYHDGNGYNYEQVMVLYNEIVRPAHNHRYEQFILDKAHVANDHLFIKGQDFGTINDFNEMFYKSDELI